MKIAVLSGAYKNAGDFLIVERSVALLKYVYPNAIIKEYNRSKSLEPILDEINSFDILLLAGGPGYQPNLYPLVVPLVEDLNRIKPKIFILGMGWYGYDNSNQMVYNYKFSNQTQKLLERVESDGFSFGCRDWYSYRVLKNFGVKNPLMTGCPAWYDLDFISSNIKALDNKNDYRVICVSDPGSTKNSTLAIELAKYLKKQYPDSIIKFIFHRGIGADKHTSKKISKLQSNLYNTVIGIGIECHDISYDSEGLNIYNECDLHIGFRVHAHIYNLSRRNVSILIEEDGRGTGVNEALGLPSIKTYDVKKDSSNFFISKFKRRIVDSRNDYLINEVDDSIHRMESNKYFDIIRAFDTMENYFQTMISHIKSMEKNLRD